MDEAIAAKKTSSVDLLLSSGDHLEELRRLAEPELSSIMSRPAPRTFSDLFATLSAEVRVQIFKVSFSGEGSWNGKTPNLIHALRTKESMNYYMEALEALRYVNPYGLGSWNRWGFWDMSAQQISELRMIEVEVQ